MLCHLNLVFADRHVSTFISHVMPLRGTCQVQRLIHTCYLPLVTPPVSDQLCTFTHHQPPTLSPLYPFSIYLVLKMIMSKLSI